MVLIGRKGAEDAFFSALRSNIDDMSAKGRDAWCSATIKAAKQRKSDLLTEETTQLRANKDLFTLCNTPHALNPLLENADT